MSAPTNPYSAPKASLDLPDAMRQSQGLEDALAGRWDFEIGEILSQAWSCVRGFKGPFWLTAVVGCIMVGVAYVALTIVQTILGVVLAPWTAALFGAGSSVFVMAIAYPLLYLPVFSAGVDRISGRPGVLRTVFDFREIVLAVAIAGLLIVLFSMLGFLLLIIPGLYVIAVYSMTVGILREHKLSPWEAMELSRKACGHHWLKIVGLFLVVGILTTLGSLLTLGFGVIWLAPWNALVYPILYRRIFGNAAETAS